MTAYVKRVSHKKKVSREISVIHRETCPVCGKQLYHSKNEVKKMAARLYPGRRMRFYRCSDEEGWVAGWHMTSQPTGETTWYREQAA